MDDNSILNSNVISIPTNFNPSIGFEENEETPLSDEMAITSAKLDSLSSYKSKLNFDAYRKLELRANKSPVRGGFVFKSPFKLVNSHSTCQQCLYAFEIDTYGRGCVHNCVYCYAKAQLSVHGYWNNPYPTPVDINAIRKVFYTVFETDKKSKWREILENRIPIRIGSMSDSFMWMDDKIGVTREFLRLLKHYKYPNVTFTRSDLVAKDSYMELLDPKLSGVQFSISSLNDSLNRKIEPGAPSGVRRLKALEKLNKNGFWTTVRINPLFPTHPDGYFTDPNFKWEGSVPDFNYSSVDMIDQIAEAGTTSVLVGMGRFSSSALNQIEKATGFNLKQFYKLDDRVKKSTRDYHYSDEEIRYYYLQYKKRCLKQAVQFTTCYIGNGEEHFWKDQDLWSNKKDCCNLKGQLSSFKSDSREIPFENRLKFTNQKCATPNDGKGLHAPLGKSENQPKCIKGVSEHNL